MAGLLHQLATAGLLGLVLCANAEGQALPRETGYVVDRWSTREGLPQSSINAMLQSRDGYLWLGTNGGLARFDGSAFTVLTSGTHEGLRSDRIRALAQDSAGRIWIGTENGAAVYEHGRFTMLTTAHGLPHNEVASVTTDAQGTAWLALASGGVVSIRDGRVDVVAAADRFDSILLKILALPDSTLLCSTGHQTYKIDPRTRPARVQLISPPISYVHTVEGGDILATERGGITLLGNGRRTHQRVQSAIGDSVIMSVVRNHDGSVWLSTSRGTIWRLTIGADGAVTELRQVADLGAPANTASLVDREGNVWVGTLVDGVRRVRPALFSMISTADGLRTNVTAAVLAARSGTVYAGGNCGDLAEIGVKRLAIIGGREGVKHGCVWSLTEDSTGAIWLGTYGGGLGRWRNGRMTWFNKGAGLPDNVILALMTARDGTVWIGTEHGVARYRNARFESGPSVVHPEVRTLTQTRDGAVWAGTQGGLSRIDRNGGVTSYTTAHGLPHNYVRTVYEDSRGQVWVGTYGGGLGRFENGRFRTFRTSDGLFDNVISSIIEDTHGNLWLSCNRGIFRVALADLDAYADGRIARIQSVVYGTIDGMISSETNGGFTPAVTKTRDGRFWYPTIAGIAVVDPKAATASPVPPAVLIDGVSINGRPARADADLAIGPGHADVEFTYSGLSLSAPDAVTFRYRLFGWDDDWVAAGTRRSAYYSRLPPGRYRFQVSAANRDGVWSAPTRAMALRIRPHFYATVWFRTLAGLVVVLGSYAALRLRLRRLEQAHARQRDFSRQLIAREENERKRIAGELHDSLGQDLLVVKNRALLGLGNPQQSLIELQEISSIAADAIRNVRQIAQNLRPYQIDRLGLTAAAKAAVEKVAEGAEMEFTAHIDNIDGALTADAEISFFRVLQEALNNVLKHSGAQRVHVQIEREEQFVRLEVTDDGRGFVQSREHAQGAGLGLTGIGERAQIMGGSFSIESAPGEGTRVRLVVPVATAKANHGR